MNASQEVSKHRVVPRLSPLLFWNFKSVSADKVNLNIFLMVKAPVTLCSPAECDPVWCGSSQ